ncbi:MAG: diguanylate cyclase [Acidobacteriia bacterium]|nr:diguanylate cyclase [Terriglobia bacterium]
MKILIAEDDPVLRRILEGFLMKWGYDLVVTKDGAEAWRALEQEAAPPLAVVDWMMPGMDGLELCRKVRERGAGPYTYILLLTAKGQKEDIVRGIEAGADDYLTKPFDVQELRVRIRAGVRVLELQEKLRELATRDPLTGLFNRGAILELLQRELARSERQGVSIGVIIADLDHFKKVNDTHGHLIGDAVLCEAAKRMKAAVRTYDFVGRYGGEEFLIFSPGCDLRDACQQAERIREYIAREPVVTPPASVQITASFGVCASGAGVRNDFTTLINAADAALYRAKERGRNRVERAVEWAGTQATSGC